MDGLQLISDISLGNIVSIIAVVGALLALERFVWRKGRDQGLNDKWKENIEKKIDDLTAQQTEHLTKEIPDLIKSNDLAHAKLDDKVDILRMQIQRLREVVLYLAVKIDPTYKPPTLD